MASCMPSPCNSGRSVGAHRCRVEVNEPKVVITGTGRAGTTLLVRILDALGLDTGIDSGKLLPYMPGVRAGLECRVDDPESPTVVKDMTLGFRMRQILEQGEVQIAHVL